MASMGQRGGYWGDAASASQSVKRGRSARQSTEGVLLAKVVGGFCVANLVLALLWRYEYSTHVFLLFALALAASCWVFTVMANSEPTAKSSESNTTGLPLRQGPAVMASLAIYVLCGLVSALASFGAWHKTDSYSFSGFERGAGWHALVAGLVLCASGLAALKQMLAGRGTTSLHCIAGAAATWLVIASVAHTGSHGMFAARSVTLLAGLVAAGTALISLLTWPGADVIFKRGVVSGLYGLLGTIIAATSFMSWGVGAFIINYVPGVEGGGFDGRFSLVAGLGVVVAAAWFGLYGRFGNNPPWLAYCGVNALLGGLGLFAIVTGGGGSFHPGRVMGLIATLAVIVTSIVVISSVNSKAVQDKSAVPRLS